MLHLSHADGEVRAVAYRNKLIVIPGRAPYVLGFGVDISEQVRAEGRLRTLTRQSDSILASVGDGIYGIDLDGRVTFVNAAATQMLGYKQDEILGHVMHNLIHHTRADGTPYDSTDSPIRKSLMNQARFVSRTRSSGARTARVSRWSTLHAHRSIRSRRSRAGAGRWAWSSHSPTRQSVARWTA